MLNQFDDTLTTLINETGRTPTDEQHTILKWIADESNEGVNGVINAVAGSGKTTTLLDSLRFIHWSKRVLFCAFNKHIAEELAAKDLPANVEARTLHSIGFEVLRKNYTGRGRLNVFGGKTDLIAKEYVDYQSMNKEQRKTHRNMMRPIRRLISLQKNFGYGIIKDAANESDIVYLANRYGLDLPSKINWDSFTQLLDAVYRLVLVEKRTIDFDDMIFQSLNKDYEFPKYDYVFVDESQDLNPVQIEIVSRMVTPETGRAIFVGDRNQAIYGFRGADTRAIDTIVERFDAVEHPLTTCWRCPKAIISLAQEIVPEIRAASFADDGEISTIETTEAIDIAESGDYFICRTNAPTVRTCLKLLKQNKKASVLGRDIGKQITSMIDDIIDADYGSDLTITQMTDTHQAFVEEQLMERGLKSQIPILYDKIATIKAFAEESNSFTSIKRKIDQIFSDERDGITLSTIHKAKGLECSRIFVLRPDLLPHPMAKQDWEKEQEANLKYVAITRSKSTLVWVRDAEPESKEGT